jgi:transposase
MPTPWISRDLRERIVAHYEKTPEASYKSTGKHFMVGEATVNRILRVRRETGDVMPVPKPKKPKNKVDLEWLRKHAETHPDARLKDRVEAFEQERGITVGITAMYGAMVAVGFTHKKKRSTRRSATPSASANSATRSLPRSPR